MRIVSRSARTLTSWGFVAGSVWLWMAAQPALGCGFALLSGFAYAHLVGVPVSGKMHKTSTEWEETMMRRSCALWIVVIMLVGVAVASFAAVGAAQVTGIPLLVPVGICYAIHTGVATASVFVLGLLRRKVEGL